jgi:hypothetical protein
MSLDELEQANAARHSVAVPSVSGAKFDGSFAPAARPAARPSLREYFLGGWIDISIWKAAVRT